MTETRKQELFEEIKSYGSTEFRGCENFRDIEEVILSKEPVDTYFEDEESYSIEEYHGDEYETIATFNFEFRGSQLHNIKVWVKVVLEDWDEEAKCYCQESIMKIEDLAIMF